MQLMNVIPETHPDHWIRYLPLFVFFIFNNNICWNIVEKQNNIKINNMAQVKRYTEN